MVIGRRALQVGFTCKCCSTAVADVDLLWVEGEPYCSVECAPDGAVLVTS